MFTQQYITAVNPPAISNGEVYISFETDAPVGTWFQCYLDRQLAWWGQGTSFYIAIPSDGVQQVDIGSVGPGEETTDFSSELPVAPKSRVRLTWKGGTFESPDIAGFYVYGSDAPGGPVDYANALATITAYPTGIEMSGFGLGTFGGGGFGEAESNYAWTSGSLTSGEWFFAIVPFDVANNSGVAQTTSVAIEVPPAPPALFPGTTARLQYSLLAFGETPWGSPWDEPEAVLTWNASPG